MTDREALLRGFRRAFGEANRQAWQTAIEVVDAFAVGQPREPGDIDCPVCKGSGVLHDITAAVEEAQAAGNVLLTPTRLAREKGS